jgi:hypothetical protein
VSVRFARLAGFVIRGVEGRPLSVGVYLRDASVEMDDLDISGAGRTAVDISGSGAAVLRASDLHDNAGPGIVVRDEARPLIVHNLVRRNGRTQKRPGVEIQGRARPDVSGNLIVESGAEAVWMPTPGDPAIRERNIFVVDGTRGAARDPVRLTTENAP